MKTSNQTKSGRRLHGLLAWVMAAAVAWVAGCQATGYKKSDVTALNSQAASQQVQAESRELDVTIGALSNLVNQPATDAKPQYLTFEKSLDMAAAAARRSEKEVDRLWKKRNAYFEVWEKEIPAIQDEATRHLSEARKKEVSTEFDAVAHRYEEAHKSVLPVIAYLQDIHKALSTDLTRDGLTAIKPSVTNATDRVRHVQNALAQSATELDTLSAKLASYRVQDVK